MLAACSFMVGTYALLFLARSFFHADPATALHAARTVSRTRDLLDMRLLTVPMLSTRSVMVPVVLSSDYCSWYLQVLTTLASPSWLWFTTHIVMMMLYLASPSLCPPTHIHYIQ